MKISLKAYSQYMSLVLSKAPSSMQAYDPNRMTIFFFCLNAIDIFGATDVFLREQLGLTRHELVEWVLKQNVASTGGFCAGPADCGVEHTTGHLTMTYCALALLHILIPDRAERKRVFEDRIDHDGIKRLFHACQQVDGDGSFQPVPFSSESDLRMTYSAFVSCVLLKKGLENNDDDHVFLRRYIRDVDGAVRHIMSCYNDMDGGFGITAGSEAQGGMTYCAMTSLRIAGKLNTALTTSQLNKTLRWCLRRVGDGFNGRANKDADTCYSYWVGCVLDQFDMLRLVDLEPTLKFALECAEEFPGVLAKCEEFDPDPLHASLGLAALSLFQRFMPRFFSSNTRSGDDDDDNDNDKNTAVCPPLQQICSVTGIVKK
eukprot:PhM_4_TR7584/c0_g1_i1/m.30325/K11713/PGTB1; geranylgeranyl transferase type-1 subunit beta